MKLLLLDGDDIGEVVELPSAPCICISIDDDCCISIEEALLVSILRFELMATFLGLFEGDF